MRARASNAQMNSYHRAIAFSGHLGLRRNLGFAMVLWAFAAACPMPALSPEVSIRQYLHHSWTQDETAPLPAIQAIAQTADSYLWLGWSRGLIRFDGNRFTYWAPHSGDVPAGDNVRTLARSSTGGLWVGTVTGFWKLEKGRVASYPQKPNYGAVASLLDDSGQSLW